MNAILKWDGGKITKPGIYADVPIDVYHDDCCDGPSISSSGLRTIVNDSPKHYWLTSYLNPDAPEQEESEALLLGRAVHHLILGQKNFAAEFVIQPLKYVHPKEGEKAWSNNAQICKDWRAEQKKKHKSILTATQVEKIKGMARSLAQDEMVKLGLLNGLVEHSLFWRDKKTGIWCKIRPDTMPVLPALTGASADICDLKTILGVDYIEMHNSYKTNAYYMQAGLIREGLREVLSVDVSTFTLQFIEKTEPHCTRPVILDEDDMDLGDEANRVGLDVMARCMVMKQWPGPGRGPGRDLMEKLKLSDRAREEIEQKLMRLRDTFELNKEQNR